MGKIVLIVRMGDQIEKLLPPMIQNINDAGLNVVWVSDPVHGNTY